MTKKEVTQLSYEIVGCAIEVHKILGPGLLESVYEKCLKAELESKGYKVDQQLNVPIIYKDFKFDSDLRLDLLVEDIVVVEIKTVDEFHPIHETKLMTYMNLMKKPQGLLINFYCTNITKNTRPFVNDYFRKLPDK